MPNELQKARNIFSCAVESNVAELSICRSKKMLAEHVPLQFAFLQYQNGVCDHVIEPSAHLLKAVEFSMQVHEDHLENLERLRKFRRSHDLRLYFMFNRFSSTPSEWHPTSCDMVISQNVSKMKFDVMGCRQASAKILISTEMLAEKFCLQNQSGDQRSMPVGREYF